MNIKTEFASDDLEISYPIGFRGWDEATERSYPNGWRMPTRGELITLYDAAVEAGHRFSDTSYVWSASSYASDPATAWGVNFNLGNSYADDKAFGNAVRLVRDITPETLPIRYSTETLYHYRCPKCYQWWTIGDCLLSTATCTKCGYSAHTENL